jgi:plastocyanin
MSQFPKLRIVLLTLLLVGLAALAPGCGGDDDSPPTGPGGGGTAADVTISIVGNAGSGSYSPNPRTVTVGQTVAWKNNDTMTHTATDDGSAWSTGNIGAGATSAPITMGTAGTFTYHCTIHAGMTGTLTVNP